MPTTPLTHQNFQTVVATDHIVLVEFWANRCVRCTRFAPVFEESARLHRDIVHATVEAEAGPALAAAGQVDRYPWLMAFREGTLVYSKSGFLPDNRLEELVAQVRWMDIEEFRRENGLRKPADAGPVVPQPQSTIGRARPAPGPQAYGRPGLRSA
ncbi:thioredoxin family protein [Nocardia sp. NPDC001965]